MTVTPILDSEVPYFSWDRRLEAGEIRRRLREAPGAGWVRLAAWIMREAAVADVWQFLSPQEVARRFAELEPYLGRRASFWKYILQTWHELGRI